MRGVVMMVNEFSPLPVGGAETQAERLSEYFAKHGWQVWVVTRHADGLLEREDRSGFQIVRPRTIGHGKMRTISFMLGALVYLLKMRRHYQILHAHLAFGPAFVAVLLGRFFGKKVIVKLGGSNAIGDVQVSMKTWRGRLRFWAIRRWADIVVALTDVMRNEALQIGIPPERIRILNNGIDASAYVYSAEEKLQAKKQLGQAGNPIALFVGRLDPVKSLTTVIDGMEIVRTSNPALRFMIVGDGIERAALELQVKQQGLEGNVIFAGDQRDVSPYLKAADMFVLPSLTEGISNALLEAMASSLPCLATPVGGNNEVLDYGKYGVMLPVADVQAWANALLELGSDPGKRQLLGQKARERIMTTYDFSVVGAQYEQMYNELISEKSNG
ncbi:hypothetical protein MASR2M66_17170 [Chloroflexota bacterium]